MIHFPNELGRIFLCIEQIALETIERFYPQSDSHLAGMLGNGAKPMEAGDLNVFSVQQLRLSGGTAEVDVTYPERGVYQLMTVKLEGGPVIPWRVQWAYRWVIPATAPVANDPMIAVEAAEADRVAAEKAAAEQPSTEETSTEQAAAPIDGN